MRRLLALLFVAACAARPPADPFEAHTFRAANGVTLPYRLLRPQNPAACPCPLVVMFHGSGAIGTDNRSQLGALAKSWARDEMRQRYPAFVLVPQYPGRTSNYPRGVAERTPVLDAGLELVQRIQETERISATDAVGFSMGGSAIWNALEAKPGLIACAVIISGVPTASRTTNGARVLLVHGDADTENPFEPAWRAYTESNGKLEFWRYEGLGHEVPPELIATPRIAQWLFTCDSTRPAASRPDR